MNTIVLITGASKGIGLALAKNMLAKNYIVIGTSRNGVMEQIQHPNFHPIALNVTEIASVKKAHREIFKRFDHIDMLINNAGIGPDLNQDLPDPISFDATFEVNVKGVIAFTEPVLEKIVKHGSLIMISSKMGSITQCTYADAVGYRVSKSALNMYTKILVNRYLDSLKVAAVHPGYVKTAISETALLQGRLTPEQAAENILAFIESDFKSGTFWDSEAGCVLPW